MVKNLRPIHGSINIKELRLLGLKFENIVDFSANISPLSPPEYLWEAINTVDLSIYPDPECLEIREAISSSISNPSKKIPIEKIFVGNGSNEIIHLLSRIFLSKNSKALIMTPTYGEYEFACNIAGGKVIRFNTDIKKDFRWDFISASRFIKKNKPKIVILCNPNNPTGTYCKLEEIETLAKASLESDCMLIVDQAYVSFVEKPWDSLKLLKFSNTILVRSMSKDYSQTALRIGYALAAEKIVSNLRYFQPEWSVNSFAQKTGICALKDKEYISKVRKIIFTAKNFIERELTDFGFETVDSSANFILIKVGNATLWRSLLLEKGVVVRDCSSFGLSEYIRVGIRIVEDCKILIQAMKEVKQTVFLNSKDNFNNNSDN